MDWQCDGMQIPCYEDAVANLDQPEAFVNQASSNS